MASPTRVCRGCGERFEPRRYDQVFCRPCGDARHDIDLVDRYLRGTPNQGVERVSIATGVATDRIRELALAGQLETLPAGLDLHDRCTCPAGDTGRCPYCRQRVAQRIAEATQAARRATPGPRGLRARR
jgi:hypothetical protein